MAHDPKTTPCAREVVARYLVHGEWRVGWRYGKVSGDGLAIIILWMEEILHHLGW